MLVQLIKSRPRLFLAFLFGVVVGLVLPSQWSVLSRVLFGWNVAVWCYLALMFWLMSYSNSTRIEQLAEQEDRADLAIVAIMSIAAAASLVAIVMELATVKELSPSHKMMHYLVTVATVAGSWFFIATIFTFHYAKMYYRSPRQHRALQFPDANLQPNYWDFLYFSFTIAVAAQTSDVAMASRPLRKTALAQSVLSFWFNMAVLGLSINIAAGLVGS